MERKWLDLKVTKAEFNLIVNALHIVSDNPDIDFGEAALEKELVRQFQEQEV